MKMPSLGLTVEMVLFIRLGPIQDIIRYGNIWLGQICHDIKTLDFAHHQVPRAQHNKPGRRHPSSLLSRHWFAITASGDPGQFWAFGRREFFHRRCCWSIFSQTVSHKVAIDWTNSRFLTSQCIVGESIGLIHWEKSRVGNKYPERIHFNVRVPQLENYYFTTGCSCWCFFSPCEDNFSV